MIRQLARALARSPFLEVRRASLYELGSGRRRPGRLANLILVRWLLDDGPRAESAWERLFADLGSPRGLGTVTLTERRLAYLQAFELGLRRPEVARLYGVSEETVKTELAVARSELGARNVTHAVANAIRRGYLNR